MNTPPTLSCIMLTQESRLAQAKLAIDDFCAQQTDVPSSGAAAITPVLSSVDLVVLASTLPLQRRLETHVAGRRNVAVYHRPIGDLQISWLLACALSRGELIAVWDDDNRNLPYRLLDQVNAYLPARSPHLAGTALTRAAALDPTNGELRLCRFGHLSGSVANLLVPTSLILERTALNHFACPKNSTPASALTVLLADRLFVDESPLKPTHAYAHLVGLSPDARRGREANMNRVLAGTAADGELPEADVRAIAELYLAARVTATSYVPASGPTLFLEKTQ